MVLFKYLTFYYLFIIIFQENAAICDEISYTQEKLLIVREECKFLMKKLKPFESQLGNYILYDNVYRLRSFKKNYVLLKHMSNSINVILIKNIFI